MCSHPTSNITIKPKVQQSYMSFLVKWLAFLSLIIKFVTFQKLVSSFSRSAFSRKVVLDWVVSFLGALQGISWVGVILSTNSVHWEGIALEN